MLSPFNPILLISIGLKIPKVLTYFEANLYLREGAIFLSEIIEIDAKSFLKFSW
jgi:hypothetical protein